MGSSPRVWGQASTTIAGICAIGIIPTRMGTRFSVLHNRFQNEDHPHAYGDKQGYTAKPITAKGSSPRVWGQVLSLPLCNGQGRIIPTRMGTRIAKKSLDAYAEDHPHAYGDKQNRITLRAYRIGSSPRVWGQEKEDKTLKTVFGIIPTRMGTSHL